MTEHGNILKVLRDEIDQGKFDAKSGLPSEAELGRRFKVSWPTAARALRELHDSRRTREP